MTSLINFINYLIRTHGFMYDIVTGLNVHLNIITRKSIPYFWELKSDARVIILPHSSLAIFNVRISRTIQLFAREYTEISTNKVTKCY